MNAIRTSWPYSVNGRYVVAYGYATSAQVMLPLHVAWRRDRGLTLDAAEVTICTARRQFGQTLDSSIQSRRSIVWRRGR